MWDLPRSGIEIVSHSQAGSLPLSHQGSPEPMFYMIQSEPIDGKFCCTFIFISYKPWQGCTVRVQTHLTLKGNATAYKQVT